ncbi:MAG: aminopeptidase N [Candidatus Nanopelagicales bacterium]
MSKDLNITRNEAIQRAGLVSDPVYTVSLELDGKGETFSCFASIDFKAQENSNTWIDLVSPLVESIWLNGEELNVKEVFNGTRIQLRNLNPENKLKIKAQCSYMNTGEGLHRHIDPVDNEVYIYTQFEVPDCRRVFPVFEQPDIKAVLNLTVKAPTKWTVISNTETPAPKNIENNFSIWTFNQTPKMSSYLYAICAGPYARKTDIYEGKFGKYPLAIFVRPSLSQYLDHEEIFEVTKQGFKWFEEKFQIGYPFKKYDQVFVPEFNAGAMENVGCVTFRDEYIFRSRTTRTAYESRANTILHELAHMWFGDLVTMKWWNDLWLNESFAEWAAHWASSGATQYNEAWTLFHVQRKAWAYRQDQLPSTHPIAANMPDLDSVYENFDGITYAKGASALRQLVAWVGEENFLKGLKNYFEKHAWKNTELKDLLNELSISSGRELDSWSKIWLESSGATLLRPEIEVDKNNLITKLLINQEPPSSPPGLDPVLRPHRLALGVYEKQENKLVRTKRIEVDVVGGQTEIKELVGTKRPDLLLINDDDLTYAKIRLDSHSLNTATKEIASIESSLSRALIWGAVWDMVRDAEVGTGKYLDLVLAGIEKETDIGLVQQVLMQCRSAIDVFADRKNRKNYNIKLATGLEKLISQAKPGSDRQLALLRTFSAVATTEEQINKVAQILDGIEKIEGLVVDTDLRWALLRRLVVVGKRGEKEIDEELKKDDTVMGREHAAGAKAAMPSLDAKQKAWEQVINNENLTNSELHSILAGISYMDHEEVLKNFVDKYFDSVSSLWNARTHEIGQSLVTGLFPSTNINQDVIKKCDEFLEKNKELAVGARRIIIEQRDSLARALKAQNADKIN